VGAEAAVYVGDDRRDVESGRAAGMRTVVAGYGYLGEAAETSSWGADHSIAGPADLIDWIDTAG
jgi:phosphoglycolate phosphatase